MTNNDKISFTLRIDEKLSQRIEKEASRIGVSKAAVIKTILDKEFNSKTSNQ